MTELLDAPGDRWMWQSYGGHSWQVRHFIPGCSQRLENVHEVTLPNGTLVARLCSECECVTYEPEWGAND